MSIRNTAPGGKLAEALARRQVNRGILDGYREKDVNEMEALSQALTDAFNAQLVDNASNFDPERSAIVANVNKSGENYTLTIRAPQGHRAIADLLSGIDTKGVSGTFRREGEPRPPHEKPSVFVANSLWEIRSGANKALSEQNQVKAQDLPGH